MTPIDWEPCPRRKGWKYTVVRLCLGISLIAAAGLKMLEVSDPIAGRASLPTAPWFRAAVGEAEILLGGWLLLGFYPRRCWQLTLGCFSLFSLLALARAIRGESSCGCFGAVAVDPRATLAFDVTAVAALLRWRPPSGRSVAGAAVVDSPEH